MQDPGEENKTKNETLSVLLISLEMFICSSTPQIWGGWAASWCGGREQWGAWQLNPWQAYFCDWGTTNILKILKAEDNLFSGVFTSSFHSLFLIPPTSNISKVFPVRCKIYPSYPFLCTFLFPFGICPLRFKWWNIITHMALRGTFSVNYSGRAGCDTRLAHKPQEGKKE